MTLVAPQTGTWVFATISPAAGAAWQFWEGGRCDLAVRLPTSIGFATWRLDLAHPPDPSATSRSLLARDSLAGAQAPGAQMLAPIVIEPVHDARLTGVTLTAAGGHS